MASSSKYYFPAAVWLVFITGMSMVPKLQLPEFNVFATDKIGHFAAYGLLVWLILFGFWRHHGRVAGWKECLVIVCGAALYGALMEVIQGNFIPGRIFGYDDMIANTLGAGLAWGTAILYNQFKFRI